jgi:hypothetical protein
MSHAAPAIVPFSDRADPPRDLAGDIYHRLYANVTLVPLLMRGDSQSGVSGSEGDLSKTSSRCQL